MQDLILLLSVKICCDAFAMRSPSLLCSWAVFVVSVESNPSNPSLSLALSSSQPLKGTSGCVIVPGERVIGAMGCGKWVWGCRKVYWRGGMA
ncbi:hypothetical protein Tco_0002459 [Tanacetum coccineum]